jgi:hypothetical protein
LVLGLEILEQEKSALLEDATEEKQRLEVAPVARAKYKVAL